MPHIKSKTSGRIFNDVDSQTAAFFVDAKLADYFEPVQIGGKVAPRPTVPTFCVVLNTDRQKYEIVCTLPNGGVQRFSGAPSDAKTAFKSLAWSAKEQAQILQGPEPSAAVLEEYRHAYGLPAAEALAYETGKRKAQEMQAAADDKALRASVRAGQ